MLGRLPLTFLASVALALMVLPVASLADEDAYLGDGDVDSGEDCMAESEKVVLFT